MRSALAIGVAAAAFGLTACGGDDSDSKSGGGSATKAITSSTAPVTAAPAPAPGKAGYIKRADRVCLAARKKLVPIRAKLLPASQGTNPDVVFRQYAKLTGQAATVYGRTADELEALEPPPADEALIDRLNQLVEQIAGIERQISAASAEHDGSKVKSLNLAVTRVFDEYRTRAQAYGFKVCGTGTAAAQRRGNR